MRLPRLRLRRREGQPSCPYCHDAIEESARVRECLKCGTRHHLDCAREAKRCTTFGCEGRFEAPTPERVAPALPPCSRSSFWSDGLAAYFVVDCVVEVLFAILSILI